MKNYLRQGRVITRYGQRQLVESSTGELFQCTGRQNIGLSVAGDEVIFQPAGGIEGIVTALLPRGNELSQKNKLIATNIGPALACCGDRTTLSI